MCVKLVFSTVNHLIENTLQDVELNELRTIINSLRQQNSSNMTADKGQSTVGSSSSGGSKMARHQHQQRQHHGSADSIKSDSGGARREAHDADVSSGDHLTKKHKSWVCMFCLLFISVDISRTYKFILKPCTLSQKSATVAGNGETTATVGEFGDSRTFLRQCGLSQKRCT